MFLEMLFTPESRGAPVLPRHVFEGLKSINSVNPSKLALAATARDKGALLRHHRQYQSRGMSFVVVDHIGGFNGRS